MTSSSPAKKSKTSSEQSPNIEPDAFVSVPAEELSLEQGVSDSSEKSNSDGCTPSYVLELKPTTRRKSSDKE